MRYLRWLGQLVAFLLLLSLAAKNSDPVLLRGFLGWEWRAPLTLILLGFFLVGVVIGVAASVRYASGQRRELLAAKKELRVRLQTPDLGG